MAYFAGTNPIIPHHVMGLVPAKYPIRDASMASLELPLSLSRVCVFITAGPSTKLFAWGAGCVRESSVCVFIQLMNSLLCKFEKNRNPLHQAKNKPRIRRTYVYYRPFRCCFLLVKKSVNTHTHAGVL